MNHEDCKHFNGILIVEDRGICNINGLIVISSLGRCVFFDKKHKGKCWGL